MQISLRKIDLTNWEDAISLKVHTEQQSFIASNLYSIAEVQFLKNFQAMGVYHNEEMIGFAMFGIDPDDGNYWIYRLMIDERFQGKGYGSEAVNCVIETIRQLKDEGHDRIMIGYHPENDGAKFAYKKAGFVETEIAPWGEQLAVYLF
ncbi:GNAT family N-acetyltransferase [Bacillus carboniphilus]|uniref:GNAT family N-acetyltransferase n=1 Tax=Bacillus carboniphilus TaxID=86663 RepID=A0ABP3GFI6_9BACI